MKKVLCFSLCAVFSLAGLAALAAEAPAPVVFNGKDFTGLKLFLPDASKDPAKTWSVKDGVIHTAPGPLNLCHQNTLHATLIPPKWKGERWWIVALHGEVVGDEEKYGCLKREIIGEAL